MSGFLLDTNVASEFRKKRADPHVTAWSLTIDASAVWLSVLVFGEIRCGIETLRRRDKRQAVALDRWIEGLEHSYAGRILPIDGDIALEWGRLNAAHGLAAVDGLLAATALVHELTLVTRNTKDVARTGVKYLNPFTAV